MLLRGYSTCLDSSHPQNGGHELAGILTLLRKIEIGEGSLTTKLAIGKR